jgi:hypothetical protein
MRSTYQLLLPASVVMALLVSGRDLIAQEPGKSNPVEAKKAEWRGANYLIFPVKTPLQRLLVRHLKAKLFVAVNGSDADQDGKLDQETLKSLHRDLDQWGSKGDIVQFNIFFGSGSGRINEPKSMFQALSELSLDVGLQFNPADGVWENDPGSWKEKVARMEEGFPPQFRGDEAAVGDDDVTVYPVQTHLSRYLTMADAYVDLREPLTGDPAKDKAVLDMIQVNVGKLRLIRKKTIGFHFYTAAPRVEYAGSQRLMDNLKTFTKSLGFEKFSLRVGAL